MSDKENVPRTLILGVGNILFSDEGLGVRALEYLVEHDTFPAPITLLDGGTLGVRLLDPIMQCEHLIVLDAVLGGGQAGCLYRLENDDLRRGLSSRASMHQTDLVDTLVCAELAGHRPHAVILGMEPGDWRSLGLELTPAIRTALPRLAAAVHSELKSQGLA